MTSYWRTLRKASPTARLYLVCAVAGRTPLR